MDRPVSLGEGYDLVRAFSARDVKFYKPSQSKPYSQQRSSTVVRDAGLPGEFFMTPPSRAVAQPGNDRKSGADRSHVMAGAWPQTHYHPSSRDTTQAHSPPGSDHGPCMVLLPSRDFLPASLSWHASAGINCPKPTHRRLLSFFSFSEQNFLPDRNPL